MSEFTGLLLHLDGRSEITALTDERLPEGDTIVDVSYSTLNYKDAMVLNCLGRLVRSYPHVPGIDFVGTVAETSHPGLAPGDAVILTGWRVGETRWGGYAKRARVMGDWLVPLPQGMTPQRAMAVGTAGLTAMLAVMRLEEHGLSPDCGRPVLVTGASGGLGSVAISVLSHLGYAVAAVTGSAAQHTYLRNLGATEIVERQTLETPSGKPLNPEKWAGAVDAVGGKTLSNLVTELAYGSSVACCGNAGGIDLSTNVSAPPFARRESVGDRFRNVPDFHAAHRMGTPDAGTESGTSGRHDPRGGIERSARSRRETPERAGLRTNRRQRRGLTLELGPVGFSCPLPGPFLMTAPERDPLFLRHRADNASDEEVLLRSS